MPRVMLKAKAEHEVIGIQPGSIHSSAVETNLLRNTVASWYRNAANRHTWVYMDPTRAPEFEGTVFDTFDYFYLETKATGQALQLPWIMQTSATRLNIVAMFATSAVIPIHVRAVGASLVTGVALSYSSDVAIYKPASFSYPPSGEWRRKFKRMVTVNLELTPNIPADRGIVLSFQFKTSSLAAINPHTSTFDYRAKLISAAAIEMFPGPT